LETYPNPTQNTSTIRIELDQATEVTITAFDITGKEVANLYSGTLSTGQNQLQFDFTTWSAGIYQLRATSNTARWNGTLMITT
jgi:hypothetical protein